MVIKPTGDLPLIGNMEKVASEDTTDLGNKDTFAGTLFTPEDNGSTRPFTTWLLIKVSQPGNNVIVGMLITTGNDIEDVVSE